MSLRISMRYLAAGLFYSLFLLGCNTPEVSMNLDSDYEHKETDFNLGLDVPNLEIDLNNGNTSPIVEVSEMTRQEFVEFVGTEACKSQRITGIPASVTIAQAILETGWGQHTIGDARNLFGIKGVGPAGSIEVQTRECNGNDCFYVTATFRKYNSFEESITDHSRFFLENPRYRTPLQHVDDPDEFARQIHAAGYATDPNYSNLLISIMSSNDLYRFNCPPD
jgi:flagellum-specific peptidoglycan hydrolase FlgJ